MNDKNKIDVAAVVQEGKKSTTDIIKTYIFDLVGIAIFVIAFARSEYDFNAATYLLVVFALKIPFV